MPAKSEFTYFRFPFVKYERETQDFSPLEHGIFLKLIMHYFTIGGPLPDDLVRLRRIAGISANQTRALEFVLSRLFHHRDSLHMCLYCDQEMTHQREISAINSANRSNGRRDEPSNAPSDSRVTGDLEGSNGQYIPVALRRQQRNHAIFEQTGMDVNSRGNSVGEEMRPAPERPAIVEGEIKRLRERGN